jgi:hypothetical protein
MNFTSVNGGKVNPSTPQPKGWGMFRVDPERRYFTRPSKRESELCWYRTGLGAAEWVNI